MKFETEVKEIITRTHDVKSFRFFKPSSFDYIAGQFMFVTIGSGNGELKKNFALSSSPTEKDFIEFTKKLTASEFSNALRSLEIGEKVAIDAPYGRFYLKDETEVGMLSGGIGITPLRSICRYCTDKQTGTKITLLYGNVTEKDIVFRDDFREMQKQNKNLKVVYTLEEPPLDWDSFSGRINEKMITKEIPDYTKTTFFICGPPAMIKVMEQLLNTVWDLP